MRLPVRLLLISGLFSEGLSLMCQQCIPLGITPCTSTQVNCSSQCATTTYALSPGVPQVISLQACSTPEMCSNKSLNLGITSYISNTKCCGTDLCNNKTLPAPPKPPFNGMMCYTCDLMDCSRSVSCTEGQDRCISMSVQQQLGRNMTFKGCASKSICNDTNSSSQGTMMANAWCCQGNLCNGAESITLSFLLMLVPLLSSILFD